MRFALSLSIALLVAGCAYPYTPPALAPVTRPAPVPAAATRTTPAERRAPVTILVSIDGFRPDYLDRGVTPALSRLKAGGVFAAMRPSFPSSTFPNHWTIVTGLRPDRNGIVGNRMEDPRRPGDVFIKASEDPFWWSEASPIWVDAEKAGIRTATMFWPGANVAIGATVTPDGHGAIDAGTRPADWHQYNQKVTGIQRVNAVLDWMRRPAAIRPRLVALYLDAVDVAGHSFGPDDPRIDQAVAEADAGIGLLTAGLAAMGQPANLVVVSDHGMAATSSDRVIALDRIADPADYRVIESGSYASLVAVPGHEAALEARLLTRHDHLRCWRQAQIPARFRYGRNPRVPAYLCLAEVGWQVDPTAPKKAYAGGAHGYDNMAPEMRALFIANGPAFVAGRTIPAFDNVEIEPLLRRLVGLPPEAGLDGDGALFRRVLVKETR